MRATFRVYEESQGVNGVGVCVGKLDLDVDGGEWKDARNAAYEVATDEARRRWPGVVKLVLAERDMTPEELANTRVRQPSGLYAESKRFKEADAWIKRAADSGIKISVVEPCAT